MKFARRQDANHNPIVDAYEKLGVTVVDLSRAAEVCKAGLPDLLCSLHGYTWLSETKTEDGALNAAQEHFIEWWKGPVWVVHSADDVIARVGEVRRMTSGGKMIARSKPDIFEATYDPADPPA